MTSDTFMALLALVAAYWLLTGTLDLYRSRRRRRAWWRA